MGSVTTVTTVTDPQKEKTAAQKMEERSPFRSQRVEEILRRLRQKREAERMREGGQ